MGSEMCIRDSLWGHLLGSFWALLGGPSVLIVFEDLSAIIITFGCLRRGVRDDFLGDGWGPPWAFSAASVHPLCDRNVHDPTPMRDVCVLPQTNAIYPPAPLCEGPQAARFVVSAFLAPLLATIAHAIVATIANEIGATIANAIVDRQLLRLQ